MEKVCSSKLGQRDLGGSCLGRREVCGSRMRRREFGPTRPPVRYKEVRLLQIARDSSKAPDRDRGSLAATPALKKLSCSRLREAELVDSKLGQGELGASGLQAMTEGSWRLRPVG